MFIYLIHLDKGNAYVRMLFIDYISAFNTMVPSKLTTKLTALGLKSSLCNWFLDFMTGHPQLVKEGNITSSTLILNTGTSSVSSCTSCVPSPAWRHTVPTSSARAVTTRQ